MTRGPALLLLATALASLPSHAPPAAEWNAIAVRLRDDHQRRDRWFANLGRVAAAIALLAIGAAGQAVLSDARAPRTGNDSRDVELALVDAATQRDVVVDARVAGFGDAGRHEGEARRRAPAARGWLPPAR